MTAQFWNLTLIIFLKEEIWSNQPNWIWIFVSNLFPLIWFKILMHINYILWMFADNMYSITWSTVTFSWIQVNASGNVDLNKYSFEFLAIFLIITIPKVRNGIFLKLSHTQWLKLTRLFFVVINIIII